MFKLCTSHLLFWLGKEWRGDIIIGKTLNLSLNLTSNPISTTITLKTKLIRIWLKTELKQQTQCYSLTLNHLVASHLVLNHIWTSKLTLQAPAPSSLSPWHQPSFSHWVRAAFLCTCPQSGLPPWNALHCPLPKCHPSEPSSRWGPSCYPGHSAPRVAFRASVTAGSSRHHLPLVSPFPEAALGSRAMSDLHPAHGSWDLGCPQ